MLRGRSGSASTSAPTRTRRPRPLRVRAAASPRSQIFCSSAVSTRGSIARCAAGASWSEAEVEPAADTRPAATAACRTRCLAGSGGRLLGRLGGHRRVDLGRGLDQVDDHARRGGRLGDGEVDGLRRRSGCGDERAHGGGLDRTRPGWFVVGDGASTDEAAGAAATGAARSSRHRSRSACSAGTYRAARTAGTAATTAPARPRNGRSVRKPTTAAPTPAAALRGAATDQCRRVRDGTGDAEEPADVGEVTAAG